MVSNILTSWNCEGEHHLLVGISGLTVTRVQSILASNARPIIVTNAYNLSIPSALKTLEKEGRIQLIERPFDIERDLQTLGRAEVASVVDKIFVNLSANHHALKLQIFEKCKVYRIPINTIESQELSTFTMLSTYSDGDFQFGITTNGKGCKLANRIKRELVSHLPRNIGDICDRVGELRARIQKEDQLKLNRLLKDQYLETLMQLELGEHEEDSFQNSKLNSFISEYNMSEYERKRQRSRWLSQIVEYYPFTKLAELSVDDLSSAYIKSSEQASEPTSSLSQTEKRAKIDYSNESEPVVEVSTSSNIQDFIKRGTISLVGAGPGSLSLLTLGALHEINTADLVLADKLVPQQVVDLIPSKTEKFIARKFPGNAEAAQEELLALGLKALQEGKKVVRLKQGDPYIFGRGGEEYLYFQQHGFTPLVLPGITSALSSTLSSQIPATQRDVADQVLICTGTGRRGVLPNIPEYVESRTTVFLMALHRIQDLVSNLIEKEWNPELPATIVERSSCPDQRVTRTKLKYLVQAVEEIGSRPPGLLVIGNACEALIGKKVNDENKWIVEEGYVSGDENIGRILKSL